MVHVNDLPVVGDTITGVVTAVIGAHTATDDDGNEVTYARYEVELQEDLTLDVEEEPGQAKRLQTGDDKPKTETPRKTDEQPRPVVTPVKK